MNSAMLFGGCWHLLGHLGEAHNAKDDEVKALRVSSPILGRSGRCSLRDREEMAARPGCVDYSKWKDLDSDDSEEDEEASKKGAMAAVYTQLSSLKTRADAAFCASEEKENGGGEGGDPNAQQLKRLKEVSEPACGSLSEPRIRQGASSLDLLCHIPCIQAASLYSEALEALESYEKAGRAPPGAEKDHRAWRLSCLMNRAAARTKMGLFVEAIEDCDKALKIER